MDLVSRVSQTRAQNRGETPAATAVIADPTAEGGAVGNGEPAVGNQGLSLP